MITLNIIWGEDLPQHNELTITEEQYDKILKECVQDKRSIGDYFLNLVTEDLKRCPSDKL